MVSGLPKSPGRCSQGNVTSEPQTRPALPFHSPPLSLQVNIPSNAVSNLRSVEAPRSTRMRDCSVPQISEGRQNPVSRQFIPPSRKRNITGLNIGMTSSPSLTGIDLRSEALNLPTPLSSSVKLESTSGANAAPLYKLVRPFLWNLVNRGRLSSAPPKGHSMWF
jgi:hypothetical protein